MTPKSDETRASARRMAVTDGLSFLDISRKLGIGVATVSRWAKAEGWPRRDKAADRAAAIAQSMMGVSPPPGKPVSSPKSDSKKIQGYTSSIDTETLTSGSIEEMAEAMLRHVFRELANFPSAANLIKLGEMSIRILSIPKLPPPPSDHSEKLAAIESRIAVLSDAVRPVESDHDAGEVPESETEKGQ